MTAKALMIQGAMSSVGKSFLVTALCRIFARMGVRVVPFKAQNMSNNAAVCADGGEIGRAQFTQAQACGVEATVNMNPILLKPEADARSQVIVQGRVWKTLSARGYYDHKSFLWSKVSESIDQLLAENQLVIIEGAGSPAELNLRQSDLVNMAVAAYCQAAVILVGDIDRGGIFAQLLGTLMLLAPTERALVRGMIVNKFRGDPSLFDEGINILQRRSNLPVLGTIPYIFNHFIPDEDSVPVESPARLPSDEAAIDIAIIALPRIANFDDFDPLRAEPGVSVRYVVDPQQLAAASAVVIPGTKNTLADYRWLAERGFDVRIRKFAEQGGAVVGICGGYQMLGWRIHDPQAVESTEGVLAALALLPLETTFFPSKITSQISARIISKSAWLAPLVGSAVSGYEIHCGQSTSHSPWLELGSAGQFDGAMRADGRVWGCYIHGLFHNAALRRAWLGSLGWQTHNSVQRSLDEDIDRIADIVEAQLDMAALRRLAIF